MHLPLMEGLGRKCLVTHFDSRRSVQDAPAGIISHQLLELFSQFHTLCRCVKARQHHACIVSLSLAHRPPPLLLQLPSLSLSGTNLGPSPTRAVNPHPALLAQPACWLCSGGFSPRPPQHHPKQLLSQSQVKIRLLVEINTCASIRVTRAWARIYTLHGGGSSVSPAACCVQRICFLDNSPSITHEADRINVGFCFLVGLKEVSEN